MFSLTYGTSPAVYYYYYYYDLNCTEISQQMTNITMDDCKPIILFKKIPTLDLENVAARPESENQDRLSTEPTPVTVCSRAPSWNELNKQ